jgi:hypothetical protein
MSEESLRLVSQPLSLRAPLLLLVSKHVNAPDVIKGPIYHKQPMMDDWRERSVRR